MRLRSFMMNHATNIYSVHFTTLILLHFFFQLYAIIPKSRTEIKQQIIIIEMPKVIEIFLLHSINLSRGKRNDENSRMMCFLK
jgi:hypothetical protein